MKSKALLEQQYQGAEESKKSLLAQITSNDEEWKEKLKALKEKHVGKLKQVQESFTGILSERMAVVEKKKDEEVS